MKKIQYFALAMLVGAACSMTSCNEKKSAENADGKDSAKTEAAKAVAEKPADLHVYSSKDIQSGMANTYAHVGFDKSVLSTLDNMMEGNTSLEALYFDHKMNMIGTSSFKNCKNLKEVHFDDVVDVIGDEAFSGCTSLKEFSASTSTYGVSAFDGCTSLETVKMDNTGWKIREGALANCPNLKTVIIPMTIDEVEDGSFKGSTGIENLAVPYNFRDRIFNFVADSKGIKNIYVLTPAFYEWPTNAACKAFNKKQCTAYVPDACIEDFKKDPSWADFAAIKPLSESGYFKADATIK